MSLWKDRAYIDSIANQKPFAIDMHINYDKVIIQSMNRTGSYSSV